MNKGRTAYTYLNAKVSLIFQAVILCITFFSRRVFLDCLGGDFLGLITLFQTIIGYINLAEMGVAMTISYVLYKPLFDKNKTEIIEIVSILAYVYRIVGLVVLGIALVVAGLVPVIFRDSPFPLTVLYSVFGCLLFSTLISYFINYRQTLLAADQRNYVIVSVFQLSNILKVLVQVCIAYFSRNYYLWALVEVVFGIGASIYLNKKIDLLYPWLQHHPSRGKSLLKKYPEILKKTRQAFLHRLGNTIQYGFTPILVYTFLNLGTIATYGNYNIIISKVYTLLNSVLGSSAASVGNLVAEGDRARITSIFFQGMMFRLYIGGLACFALFSFMSPFISWWLGEDYVLPSSVVFIFCLTLFSNILGDHFGQFINAYGLFSDIVAPYIQAILNVGLSVFLGIQFGLIGILLGPLLSSLIIWQIWKPYYLCSQGFHISLTKYYIAIAKGFLFISMSYLLTITAHSVLSLSLLRYHLDTISCVVIYSIVLTALFLLGDTNAHQCFTKLFKIRDYIQ